MRYQKCFGIDGELDEWFLVIKAHGQSLLFNLNKKDGFLMTTDIF